MIVAINLRERMAAVQPWLMSAICAVLAFKVSWAYTLSFFLLAASLLDGNVIAKLVEIARSRLCLAFISYVLIYLLAMAWTTDMAAGWKMVGRQVPLLLFSLYWSSASHADRERHVSAFLIGLVVCALLAHYNWVRLYWLPELPAGIEVTKSFGDTAPFVDRIMFAPLLAVGTYLALRRALGIPLGHRRAFAALAAALLLSNLLFSGGRAGLVMFIAMATGLAFEAIRARLRALLLCALLIPASLFGVYQTSDYFAQRVDAIATDLKTFEQNPNTSVGQRLVYWATSWDVFSRHPLIGAGSGDFQLEYARAKPEKWAMTPDSYNPHNQFLMTGATTGLLGIAALVAIFGFAARAGGDARTYTVLAGFAIVSLFESYLWRSNTALAFSVLIAVFTAPRRAGPAGFAR